MIDLYIVIHNIAFRDKKLTLKCCSIHQKIKGSIITQCFNTSMALNIDIRTLKHSPISSNEIEVPDQDTVPNKLIVFFSTIGIIGNFISFCVLNRRPFRNGKLYAYLSSLSLVDLCYLIFTLVRHALALSK